MVQPDEHLTQLLLFIDLIRKKLEISCIFFGSGCRRYLFFFCDTSFIVIPALRMLKPPAQLKLVGEVLRTNTTLCEWS